MKKIFFCLVVTITTFACSNAQKKEFPKESLTKSLVTPANTKISFDNILKKHLGKVTVIEVWASWCGDCVKAMPKIKETQAAYPDVDYVFISMDKDFEKWKMGIKQHNLVGDHYWATDGMKGEFGQSINLDWIPRYIIIDKKGEILTYRAVETDFDKINEALRVATSQEIKTQNAQELKP